MKVAIETLVKINPGDFAANNRTLLNRIIGADYDDTVFKIHDVNVFSSVINSINAATIQFSINEIANSLNIGRLKLVIITYHTLVESPLDEPLSLIFNAAITKASQSDVVVSTSQLSLVDMISKDFDDIVLSNFLLQPNKRGILNIVLGGVEEDFDESGVYSDVYSGTYN